MNINVGYPLIQWATVTGEVIKVGIKWIKPRRRHSTICLPRWQDDDDDYMVTKLILMVKMAKCLLWLVNISIAFQYIQCKLWYVTQAFSTKS